MLTPAHPRMRGRGVLGNRRHRRAGIAQVQRAFQRAARGGGDARQAGQRLREVGQAARRRRARQQARACGLQAQDARLQWQLIRVFVTGLLRYL